MTATDTAFTGSIAELYDRYMVPLLFRPYAEIVAERARALAPARILETAAGTGVVTEALHAVLPQSEIVATDLNPPMLELAARRIRSPKVRFEPADALDLPFDDHSFDLVVCQFGVMFFPDKVRGNTEARRVLRDGGRYLIVVWDRIERNLATHESINAVAPLFPANAASFYNRVPFGYADPALIERDLRAAGFDDIAIETVALQSRLPSARDAATGLVQGTPVRAEIEAIDPSRLGPATEASAAALLKFEGPDGFAAPMSAHIATAIR